ncbi:MFS transporter [Pseudomaricurvus sp. HS19]|uniref:spinster family MFS transporter n=1 Tax=Pseudomaricurvus sp. HS19 TaxID=2692626 RepID=UPI00136D6D15|nr:MFS transporter [Pseudomaricurvus sp. HS19]MYM64045.1 MFS transporter [Pseudomaricurvus sp. HS19]
MSSAAPAPVTATAAAPYPPAGIAWYATFLLALLYWLSILDRFIISLLVGPIKQDLGLTDVQFGLLHGLAFALTYSLFGLIAGSLADRFSRRKIICLSVAIWSVATAACGLAQNFWQLLVARIGVGSGESGLNPSATSMITDLFPRDRLTTAMAVYTIGATLGSGMAYLFGGLIVDLVAGFGTVSLPLIGDLYAWQTVFFIIGLPGVLLAFIIFTIPEPERRDRRSEQQHTGFWRDIINSYGGLFRYMKPRWQFFTCHYLGFSLSTIVLSGAAIWYPAHMSRKFGWTPSEIGMGLGVALMIGGISGKLIGGYFIDRMYRRGYRDAQLRWYIACLLIGAPVGVFAAITDNQYAFLLGIGLFTALLAPMPACSGAALNLVTPNELRGIGIALFAAVFGLIGSGTGPVAIAAIAEHVFGNSPASLGYGLATAMAICCPLAALVLTLGLKPMREAAREFEQQG